MTRATPARCAALMILALTAAMTTAGCASADAALPPSRTDNESEPPVPAPPTERSPAAPVSTDQDVVLRFGGNAVPGVLQNSAATAALVAQLPLDLSFADFGGQEKIAGLPVPLPLDNMPTGGSAEAGTIGYYVPNQSLVFYYQSVGYYPGIIPLGTFDDVAAIRESTSFTGTLTID